MKNRNKIIYVFFMMVLVVWLCLSNSIIVSLDKINFKLEKADIADYESNSIAHIVLPDAIQYNNMLETVAITGLGGCETEYNNDHKKVTVLLHNEDRTYKVQANNMFSGWTNGVLGTEKVQGVNNNFSTEFSTLPMKMGEYQVYIYFWENEYNYGLAETDIVIEKNLKGVKTSYLRPIEALGQVEVNDQVKLLLWNDLSTNKNDPYYTINGLAYMLGKDSTKQKVYVEFTDNEGNNKTYPTVLTDSKWVKEQVGEEYIHSNFIVRIAKQDIELEDTVMRIIVENEGNYTSQDVFKYRVDDAEGGFKQVYEKPVDNFENVQIEDKFQLTLWSDLSNQTSNLYYALSGLAYILDKDATEQEVYVEFTDQSQRIKTYKALLRDNEWVKENVGSLYAHADFQLKIAKEDIAKEDIQMRIIINNDGAFTHKNIYHYKFDKEQNKFIKADK